MGGWGMGRWGDGGMGRDREGDKVTRRNYFLTRYFPITNYQLPITNAQCPMPNAQFLMPNS
ncbi:MAG: hypothetical protein WBA39_05080 [Rivularia sp. (in: cyanobacteria)]